MIIWIPMHGELTRLRCTVDNWHCGWWVIVKLRLLRFCWVGSSVTWTNQHVELVYVVQYVSVVLVVDDEGKRSREGLCRCTMCSEGRTRTLGPRDRGPDGHGWFKSSTRTTRGFAEGVKMALTQVKVGPRQVKWGPRMNWRSLAEDEVDMHRHWVIWRFQLKTTSKRFLCFGLKTGVANRRTHVISWSLCQGEAKSWRH